jgi:hypothetical protein
MIEKRGCVLETDGVKECEKLVPDGVKMVGQEEFVKVR